MNKEKEIKKVCGFYASNMHFITMILPYLSKQIEGNKKIVTFFQNDLSKEIETILTRVNISKEKKEKIRNLEWNKKEKIDSNKRTKESLIIIVGGTKEYVEEINKKLENNKENEKNVIINCFEINEEKYSIRKIVEKYQYLINTTGIRKKEEICI